MSTISRFTTKAVTLAKNVVGGRGESAAPEGGGGFANYAIVSLHCLRIYLEKSYREALDLLSEMPNILEEIGHDAAGLPDPSTLVKAFDRIEMAVWRVLLCLSAQEYEPSGHAVIDLTFPDRETASTHYCRRTDDRVKTLKNDGARRYSDPGDPRRSLYGQKNTRDAARLAGHPPERGRPAQPRR